MEILKIPVLLLLYIIVVVQSGFAQQSNVDLILYVGDIRIEESSDGDGLILHVRKKPNINSVLLTESSESPSHDVSTYALRAQKHNIYNGDEQRILNGQFIRSKNGYFIIDSTPEPDVIFGYAFVLFVPYQVIYGYQNTRHGTLNFLDMSNYISIRAFEKMYADYGGIYQDNSFLINKISNVGPSPENILPVDTPEPVAQNIITDTPETAVRNTTEDTVPIAVAPSNPAAHELDKRVEETSHKTSLEEMLQRTSTDKYDKTTIRSFTDIADKAGTKAVFLRDKDDIATQLASLVDGIPHNESLDMVLLLDTTRSMWNDMSAIKSAVVPELNKVLKGRTFRIGIVLYRDFDELYLTKHIEFSDQLQTVQRQINTIQAGGGGDWSEAVHEALKEAVEQYTWVAENRIIVIIGDAPAHDPPRNGLDVEQIYKVAKAKNIAIYPFIVPRK